MAKSDTVATLEYQAEMDKLLVMGNAFAGVLEGIPLEKIRRTLDVADSVGAIVYPTAYHHALSSGSLEAQTAAVQACREFSTAWAKIRERAKEASDDGS